MDVLKIVFQHFLPRGNTSIIFLLLSTHKNICSSDAIITAAICGHADIILSLIAYDNALNNKHIKSYTRALSSAACRGRVEIMNLLLAAGADPRHTDNLAIRTASSHGYSKAVELLLADPRVDPTVEYNYAIRFASFQGHVKVVKLLLADSRVDPTTHYNYCIRIASEEGHTGVVKLLLRDPRVNPFQLNNIALEGAVDRNQVDVVRLILRYNPRRAANSSTADIHVDNLLYIASTRGKLSMTKLLIETNVIKVEIINTAICFTFINGHNNVLLFLLEKIKYNANITNYIRAVNCIDECIRKKIPNKIRLVDKIFRDHVFSYYIVIRKLVCEHLLIDLLPLFL
mgnify:FL=1